MKYQGKYTTYKDEYIYCMLYKNVLLPLLLTGGGNKNKRIEIIRSVKIQQ